LDSKNKKNNDKSKNEIAMAKIIKKTTIIKGREK
jgi:hypothetical protein